MSITTNHKNEKINELINLLCDREEEKNESCKLYRGFICGSGYTLCNLLKMLSFSFGKQYGGGYSFVIDNNVDMVTVGYCEGDIVITVHDNINDYNREVLSTKKFYDEE